MKTVYFVTNDAFNQEHNKEIVGEYFEISPSYTVVLKLDLDKSVRKTMKDAKKTLWRNFHHFKYGKS
jgi:hypothetical protein